VGAGTWVAVTVTVGAGAGVAVIVTVGVGVGLIGVLSVKLKGTDFGEGFIRPEPLKFSNTKTSENGATQRR